MISQQRLEKAMTFLAETDEPYAEALMEMERAEFKAKAIKDAVFLHSDGTVAERAAIAGASDEYHNAMEEYFVKLRVHGALKNKRQTEDLVVEVWRSLEASRRKL